MTPNFYYYYIIIDHYFFFALLYLPVTSIKRDIGHLCHDERKPPQGKSGGENSGSGIVQQPPLNLTQASSDPSRSLQREPSRPISNATQGSEGSYNFPFSSSVDTYGLGAEATTIMPWNTNVSAGFNSYGFPVDTSSTNNEFSFLTFVSHILLMVAIAPITSSMLIMS